MQGVIRGCLALLATALVSGVGMLNASSVGAVGGIKMQALLNDDGSGHLFVNTPRDLMTWEVCSPTLSNCMPFGSGGTLNTMGVKPETVFRVTGDDGSTGLSPVWHGNVASLLPPSVKGHVRANELVTPVPGRWQGDWEGGGDFLQLAACRSRNGTHCTTLTDDHYPGSCPNSAAVIDPTFAGDFLRVANQRLGAGPHIVPMYASRSPYAARGGTWEASPVTSVAVVGRIAAATRPRIERCGFPPLNQVTISKKGVAKVQCGLGCRAVLIAKRGRQRARVVRKAARWQTFRSPMTLRFSPRSLARLGAGRVQFIVKIDGKSAARRLVVPRVTVVAVGAPY
jgi:hypothetical protein